MVKEKNGGPKLPVRQLGILAVVRFAEPVALTSVFPYLPEMIQSFGVPKEEVAKWAGLTSAVFSIAQSVTAVPWGWASDSIGRKYTLVFGMLSTMICFIFWGTSTSLPMAIAVRGIHGGSNGNVGIIRTMVAEMVPEKVLQPRAFSIMPMVWSVGSVFGPSFGGFFAQPAVQYPNVFGHIELFKKYPFLLPNLIAFIFFIFSVCSAVLFLEETLESRRYKRDWGLELGERLTRIFRGGKPAKRSRRQALARTRAEARAENRSRRRSFVDDEASAPLLSAMSPSQPDLSLGSAKPPTAVDATDHVDKHAAAAVSADAPKSSERMFTYQTTMALVAYSLLALHSVAYDQVLPVFLNYPHQTPDANNTKLPFKFSGGFGLSSGRIGTIFTLNALISGFAQFIAFPPLCTRFGALRCFRVGSLFLPFVYFLTPYTTLIPDERLRYGVFLFSFILKGCLSIVTFPCITIILTNSASSVKVLGTLNGFATTFSGIGKAIGPAMTGAAFTWGLRHGYIITGWWFLAAISTIGTLSTFFIDEGHGLNNSNESREDGAGGEEEELEGDPLDEEEGDFSYEYTTDDDDDDDYEESLLGDVNEEDEDYYINNVSSRPHSNLHSRAHSRARSQGTQRSSAHSLTHSPTHSRTSSHHWTNAADLPLPAPSASLFPSQADQTSQPGSEPPSPVQQRRAPSQLPKLRPPTAPHDMREPEDPDPYGSDAEGAVGLGLGLETSVPSSPIVPRRFRSGSVLSRRGRDDVLAAANMVQLSPVVPSSVDGDSSQAPNTKAP